MIFDNRDDVSLLSFHKPPLPFTVSSMMGGVLSRQNTPSTLDENYG